MSAGSAHLAVPPEPLDQALLREQAWIGDSVLALFARSWILENRPSHADQNGMFIRMTSNQFLSAFGEPTKVEARIGRVYQAHGLEAAFAYLNEAILPLFAKHELRRSGGGRR